MGRKRNQGKARKAAKAKAREEEEDGGENNNLTTANNGSLNSPTEVFMEHMWNNEKCWHHVNNRLDFNGPFVEEFHSIFIDAAKRGDLSLGRCLVDSRKATLNEFADKWKDAAEVEKAMSFFWFAGTQLCIKGDYDDSRDYATIARFFEQHIAVELKQTQALINWPKIDDTHHADLHTLVKFYRHRIPCSCLDEKYQQVKSIAKVGHCYNPKCSIPGKTVERSRSMYCSRCRCITYCSRECQEADWTNHKGKCDEAAVRKAKFEARQQNM